MAAWAPSCAGFTATARVPTAQECPVTPIYFYNRNNLRRPEVKGSHGNLLDQHPLKGVYLDPE